MALTLNALVGFETEGLEEDLAVSGSPVVDSNLPVRTGTGSLKINGASPTAGQYDIDVGAVSRFIFGFACQVNDLELKNDSDFFQVIDTSSGVSIALRLKTDGDVDLIRNGTVAATLTTPFTVNTWHFVEIGIIINGSSGKFIVVIDGSNQLNESSVDTLASATSADFIRFTGFVCRSNTGRSS